MVFDGARDAETLRSPPTVVMICTLVTDVDVFLDPSDILGDNNQYYPPPPLFDQTVIARSTYLT